IEYDKQVQIQAFEAHLSRQRFWIRGGAYVLVPVPSSWRHSKLKIDASSGRCNPSSWYCSQILAQGRPKMSGTRYSKVWPGAIGVVSPSSGKACGMHSM